MKSLKNIIEQIAPDTLQEGSLNIKSIVTQFNKIDFKKLDARDLMDLIEVSGIKDFEIVACYFRGFKKIQGIPTLTYGFIWEDKDLDEENNFAVNEAYIDTSNGVHTSVSPKPEAEELHIKTAMALIKQKKY